MLRGYPGEGCGLRIVREFRLICYTHGFVDCLGQNRFRRDRLPQAAQTPAAGFLATYNLPTIYSTILAQFAAASALNVSYSMLCDPSDLSEIARITTKGVLFR